MPLSNAERQRRYRLRHGLGVPQERVKLVLDFPDLPPLKKLPYKGIYKHDKPLSERSKSDYTSGVKHIYKDHTGKDLPDNHPIFDVLENKSVSYKNVKDDFGWLNKCDIKPLIQKNYRNVLYTHLVARSIRGFTEFAKKFIPYRMWHEENYHERRAEKEIEPISFDRDEIIKNMNSLQDTEEKMLYGLLMLIPTRRIGDYRNTIIENKHTKYPNDFNIYKDGKIEIYNTKSDTRTPMAKENKKPIFIIDIPPEVDNLIDKSNAYLFNKPISVGVVFNKIYGRPYTNIEIRRLYASHIKDLKYKERKKLADAMGHSVEENLKYVL